MSTDNVFGDPSITFGDPNSTIGRFNPASNASGSDATVSAVSFNAVGTIGLVVIGQGVVVFAANFSTTSGFSGATPTSGVGTLGTTTFAGQAAFGSPIFPATPSPDMTGATPNFPAATPTTGTTLFAANFDVLVGFPVPQIQAITTTAPAVTTTLYSLVPTRDFVSAPSFVRWRHRFRGQRESYKFNAEISAFIFDVRRLYEKYGALDAKLSEHVFVLVNGGSVNADIFFADALTAATPAIEGTFGFGADGFGAPNTGRFGAWAGVGTPTTVTGDSVPMNLMGVLEMSDRIERLRHRVRVLEGV